jgi:hypothetical protein
MRVAIALVLALAGRAAADGQGFMHRLADAVAQRLDAAAAAHVPKPVPPQPIDVKWSVKKIGSYDLGAPLVALTAADLDGDGKPELYAVTSREIVAFALGARGAKEIGRVAFTGEPAMPPSRSPVGTALAEGTTLTASVSGYARSMRVHWRGKQLVGDPGEPGFAVCPNERVQLVSGRNYFDGGAYDIRCRGDLVDTAGFPLRVRAVLSTKDKLDVLVDRCDLGGATCESAGKFSYANVGVAFAIADVDRDGRPEIIYSGAGASDDPDTVRVVTLGDDKKHGFRHQFAGGVVAIATVEGGPVIAAVRLAGVNRTNHFDLWRLD